MSDDSKLQEFLSKSVDINATDIFIVPGVPVTCKKGRELVPLDETMMLPQSTESLIAEIYRMTGREMDKLAATGDDDFSFAIAKIARFRCSTYKQRGSYAAVIRVIPFGIPDYKEMGIPEEVMKVADMTKGLVLVTGPAGAGKSTTLACIIDRINSTRQGHIITLEEPIEYLHRNKLSIVSQREIELDSQSFVTALRACLRQSPDVILVGEMRDYDTVQTCMTAVETGHLVISTLHTVGAANTIDRIIDVFPPSQQTQIRVQIAMLLKTVISQQLVPTTQGGILAVFEIMHLNSAIRNMIRESKIHQIDTAITAGAQEGMRSMDADLLEYARSGRIEKETAIRFALNPELMEKRIKLA